MASFIALNRKLCHQKQGLWGTEWVLQAIGKMSPDMLRSQPTAGTVVHFDSVGDFQPGCSGNQVAMTLFARADGFDVALVSEETIPHFATALPSGNLGALVHLQGFEIETTQFYLADAASFAYNDPLHAPTEAQTTDDEEAGLLFRARNWAGGDSGALALGTNHICGYVSKPVRTGRDGVKWLSYWTANHPGTA